MDTDLRDQFDRAVSDDPGADPAEMALAAIAEGGRIRRRRRQVAAAGVAAGLVLVLGTVAAVNLRSGEPVSDHPPVTIAAAMRPPAAPSCSVDGVADDATDVAIFLTADATDRQRAAVTSALDDDPRVGTVRFEGRAEAYERFRKLWSDSPEFVASVSPRDLPESFRLRLVDYSQYKAFHAKFAAMAGVQDIVGRICPPSAPVGGVQ